MVRFVGRFSVAGSRVPVVSVLTSGTAPPPPPNLFLHCKPSANRACVRRNEYYRAIHIRNLILAPSDVYAVLQGAGFNSRTMQHVHQPIVVILMDPVGVFLMLLSFFFFVRVCMKNVNPVIYIPAFCRFSPELILATEG
jgi:hypothetical protein